MVYKRVGYLLILLFLAACSQEAVEVPRENAASSSHMQDLLDQKDERIQALEVRVAELKEASESSRTQVDVLNSVVEQNEKRIARLKQQIVDDVRIYQDQIVELERQLDNKNELVDMLKQENAQLKKLQKQARHDDEDRDMVREETPRVLSADKYKPVVVSQLSMPETRASDEDESRSGKKGVVLISDVRGEKVVTGTHTEVRFVMSDEVERGKYGFKEKKRIPVEHEVNEYGYQIVCSATNTGAMPLEVQLTAGAIVRSVVVPGSSQMTNIIIQSVPGADLWVESGGRKFRHRVIYQ